MVNINIRGAMTSKLDEIKVTKDDFGADVLAISETWCTSNIPDGSFTSCGFNVYRRDRQDGRQHGESLATSETPSLLNKGPK